MKTRIAVAGLNGMGKSNKTRRTAKARELASGGADAFRPGRPCPQMCWARKVSQA